MHGTQVVQGLPAGVEACAEAASGISALAEALALVLLPAARSKRRSLRKRLQFFLGCSWKPQVKRENKEMGPAAPFGEPELLVGELVATERVHQSSCTGAFGMQMKLVQSPRASSKAPMPQSGEEPGGENAASLNTGDTGTLTAMFEVTPDDVDVGAGHVRVETWNQRDGCVAVLGHHGGGRACWRPRWFVLIQSDRHGA